jgi:NADP-dependent 3-hydroxy acid dehydrogenase YdfG
VTGASSGLGAELAIQLTGLGAQVIMSARRLEKLQEVAKKCVGTHKPALIPLDVTDYDASTSAYAEVKARWGQVDMIVLNAGRSQRMAGE